MAKPSWILIVAITGLIPVAATAKGKVDGTHASLCGVVSDVQMVGRRITGKFTGMVTLTTCMNGKCRTLDMPARSIPIGLSIAKRGYFFVMAKRRDDPCKFDGGAIRRNPQDLFEALKAGEGTGIKVHVELVQPILEIGRYLRRIEAGLFRVTDIRIK